MKFDVTIKTIFIIFLLGSFGCGPKSTMSITEKSATSQSKPVNKSTEIKQETATTGTVGVVDFSNAVRRLTSALMITKPTTLSQVNNRAQVRLPRSNEAAEIQDPAVLMALQQYAIAACNDMINENVALKDGSRPFLNGIDLTKNPAINSSKIDPYINTLSEAFLGISPADSVTASTLKELFINVSKDPYVLGLTVTEQTKVALKMLCSAVAMSPKSLSI